MAGADTTHITARLLGPDLIERTRANALSCPLYSSGALVAPASGTVTIYDEDSTEQVSAAAVTIAGSVASYSYTPAASVSLAEGWRVEWTLIVDGVTHVFRNDAALVRARLYPVVTDADLFRRASALNPAGSAPITSITDFQDYLDEAWAWIQLKLIAKGNRPNLIMSPSAFRELHLCKTLELVFVDLASRLNEAYQVTADKYHADAVEAWRELNWHNAYADDEPDYDATKRTGARPSYWLTSRG